jgi:hypothetical protein
MTKKERDQRARILEGMGWTRKCSLANPEPRRWFHPEDYDQEGTTFSLSDACEEMERFENEGDSFECELRDGEDQWMDAVTPRCRALTYNDESDYWVERPSYVAHEVARGLIDR